MDQEQLYTVFSHRTKIFVIVMATFASLFSALSSTIYLPALNTLATDFKVSSADINLTVTTYMIMQGLAPMFFGDLADRSGRRQIYILAFIVYFFANLGLALQDSYAALLVLRALQSSGSSATIAIGNGVVSDVVTSAERGSYIGWVTAAIMLGPALAPTIGGLLAQFLGWRSIFWFLLIAGAIYLVLYTIFVPETGRNVVGNGSIPPIGANKSVVNCLRIGRDRMKAPDETISQDRAHRPGTGDSSFLKLTYPNPFKALRIVVEKDVAIILLFTSLVVTVIQCVTISLPKAFQDTYGFNDWQIGLCYIPPSVGGSLGTIGGGKLLDYNYKRVARQIGVSIDKKRGNDLRDFPIERARLEVVLYPLALGISFFIAWGWVVQARTNLAGPLVVLFFHGVFSSAVFSMLTTLIVDLYPQSPSTATAALNLVRCLLSAVGTAVIQLIIDAMGLGWCFTFLALLVLAASPGLWVVRKWGPKWREQRFVRELKKKEGQHQELADQSGEPSQDQIGGEKEGGAEEKGVEDKGLEEKIIEEGKKTDTIDPETLVHIPQDSKIVEEPIKSSTVS